MCDHPIGHPPSAVVIRSPLITWRNPFNQLDRRLLYLLSFPLNQTRIQPRVMSVPGNHHDSNIGNVPQEPSVAADEDAIEPLPAPRVGGEGRPFDYSIATEESLRDLRCEVLVNYLQSQQEEKLWTTGEPGEGVVLRKTKGQYVCSPPQLQTDGSDLLTEVSHLNVMVHGATTRLCTGYMLTILGRHDGQYKSYSPYSPASQPSRTILC